MAATRHINAEPLPRPYTPDTNKRRLSGLGRPGVGRRVGILLALGLIIGGAAACRDMSSGTPSPINTDKCGTVFVPGPINEKGEVDPPGSTVPLDYCEVQQ